MGYVSRLFLVRSISAFAVLALAVPLFAQQTFAQQTFAQQTFAQQTFAQQTSAQQPAASVQQPSDPSQQQVVTSDVLRVPPPSPNATAANLEQDADLLRMKKAYLDSVDYYRAAMKKSDTAVLHNKTGICLLLLRRDSEARKEFQLAIKADKDYAEVYNNMGALNYNARKYGAAIREYRKAIRLTEANASFHSNLGTAYFSQKDYDHASKEYQRAMQIDPGIFERSPSGGVSVKLVTSNDLGHFHYVMAQMYGQHGDQDHCRFYLSKANEEGYPIKGALRDNEFAGLRKDPNFIAFVRSLKPPPGDRN